MISIKLLGGIGNAMFQIATIEYLGKKFNKKICYSNIDCWIDGLKENYGFTSHAEDYLYIFPNINFYKNHNQRFGVKRSVELGFRYADILPSDGDLFIGHVQSEMNFPDKGFIEWLFTPSNAVNEKLKRYDELFNGITCSIHIRRGDYMNWQEFHPILGVDYYTRAIEKIASLIPEKSIYKVDKYLIFSDDIDWCKNNFWGDQFVFIKDTDYVELFLMSKCFHHIISNSSFAWWGAWLGERELTLTIAPKMWFGRNMPEDYDADIVPKNRWMKL